MAESAGMQSVAVDPVRSLWLRTVTGPPLLSLFRLLLVLYIFMLVLLPSGSLFGVNLKVICFFTLLPVALQVSLARKQMTLNHLGLFLGVPTVVLLWCLGSQLYGVPSEQAIAQYRDVMVTIATCWFAVVLCNGERKETLFLLRWILYAELATSTMKVMLLVYAFARGIPVSSIIEMINQVFGVQLMPFDFESLLGRLEFISDNLIPICMFAILAYRSTLRIRAFPALGMLLVLLISDFFSFSRYLWVFAVIAILCGLIVGKKDRFQATLLALITVAVLSSLPLLITIVSLRFSETVVTSSDIERTAQVAALQDFIRDAPWFGHGLGSYTTRVIRSDTAPYSYEAQLLALLGQMGLVGVVFLTVLTLYYFRAIWPSRRQNWLLSTGLAAMLIAWLAGGFLNPSVISSAAAVSYAAIYAMAGLKDDSPTKDPAPFLEDAAATR